MTKEELKQRIADIDRNAQLQKKDAYRQFVYSNAKYKRDDVVSDSSCKIRIEGVSYSLIGGEIVISYYGPALTKKGEPRKDGERRYVFESAIK